MREALRACLRPVLSGARRHTSSQARKWALRAPPSDVSAFARALVFLQHGEHDQQWGPWLQRFNQAGYNALLVHTEPTQKLAAVERDIGRAVGEANIGPAPVLFARDDLTRAAETYVSSNPLGGLVLVDPSLASGNAFDYEPTFPIALIADDAIDREQLRTHHRLLRDGPDNDVEVIVIPPGAEIDPLLEWMSDVL